MSAMSDPTGEAPATRQFDCYRGDDATEREYMIAWSITAWEQWWATSEFIGWGYI